jgi:death on curing protein
MIGLADILLLHEFSLSDYGGGEGIRDEGLLLSAISRPFQTFDGRDLYSTPLDKATAIAESLIVNHPFVDGNKRVGMLAMLAVLAEYGFSITADSNSLYDLIIMISTGRLGFDGIVGWLEKNTRKV